MLDDNDVAVWSQKTTDQTTSGQTLLDIEEGRGLVKHVDIGLLDTDNGDRETLQLTTGEEVNVTIVDLLEFCCKLGMREAQVEDNVLTESLENLVYSGLVDLSTLLDQVANGSVCALDSPGDLVDVLRLDNSLEVVLQNLGEVVLQLRATEVLENLLPVWWVVETAQVWLELSAQNLQRRALANTVCSNKTQNLARSGHRQSVQLEAVCRVAVSDLRLEVGGQVDDVDGVKGAFLGADTTSNAQALGDEGDLGLGGDLNAQLAGSDDWAGLLALLSAFLWALSAFANIFPHPASVIPSAYTISQQGKRQ